MSTVLRTNCGGTLTSQQWRCKRECGVGDTVPVILEDSLVGHAMSSPNPNPNPSPNSNPSPNPSPSPAPAPALALALALTPTPTPTRRATRCGVTTLDSRPTRTTRCICIYVYVYMLRLPSSNPNPKPNLNPKPGPNPDPNPTPNQGEIEYLDFMDRSGNKGVGTALLAHVPACDEVWTVGHGAKWHEDTRETRQFTVSSQPTSQSVSQSVACEAWPMVPVPTYLPTRLLTGLPLPELHRSRRRR